MGLRLACNEIKYLLGIALPLLVRFLFLCAADRITIAFVGQYDPDPKHFAAVVFGKVYSNVTGLSVGHGLGLGINTFCAQNHGRGADHKNGVVFWQCAKVLTLAFAFSGAAAVFSAPLLEFLQQPKDLLPAIEEVVVIQAIGLPGVFFGVAANNVLVSQNIVVPGVISDCLGSASNIILAFLFLWGGMGFTGVAWAVVVSNYLSAFAIFFYVVCAKRQNTVWKRHRRFDDSREDSADVSMCRYAQTAFASGWALWAEWWASETLAFFAGWLPGTSDQQVATVAAHGILMNTLVIFYMTFVAFQYAATTRIGNLVGARQAQLIPTSIGSGVVLALVVSSLTSVVLYFFMPSFVWLFNSNADIHDVVASSTLGIVLSVPPYSLVMFLLGVMRGADLQSWGAIAVSISFFIIGLPIGYMLGVWEHGLHMGLLGVWMGNVIGLCCSTISMIFRVGCINWRQIVDEANDDRRNTSDVALTAVS